MEENISLLTIVSLTTPPPFVRVMVMLLWGLLISILMRECDWPPLPLPASFAFFGPSVKALLKAENSRTFSLSLFSSLPLSKMEKDEGPNNWDTIFSNERVNASCVMVSKERLDRKGAESLQGRMRLASILTNCDMLCGTIRRKFQLIQSENHILHRKASRWITLNP